MRKAITKLVILFLAVTGIIVYSTGLLDNDDNVVKVYSYGDYIDPDLIDMFEKETGIKVIYDTYDTNEEMYPVIKNRAGIYDVICPSDYMIEKMKKEGLLQTVNKNNIPNLKYIDEEYLELLQGFDKKNEYAVPYQWGTCGILYNTKKIPEGSITSWKDLWNPKYKGSIVMQDSIRDTLMVPLKMMGYSLNSTEESQLKEAVAMLDKQKPLVYKYANDSARDLLVGESADIGVVWNGEMLYAQELNPNLAFVVPKEGTELFVDAWAIPKVAEHKENAEKWIDFMCRPDVAMKNFEYLTYSTPNKKTREMLDEEYRDNPNLFPSTELLKKSEVLKDLSPEITDLYSKYWKIFKSE